jgi:hypothetical protein
MVDLANTKHKEGNSRNGEEDLVDNERVSVAEF